MEKHNFRVGDVIQSSYKNRWFGIILKLESRTWNSRPINDIATLQITHTPEGKPQRKKNYITKLDVCYLEKVGPNSQMYAIVKGLPIEDYNLVHKFDEVINSIQHLYEVTQNISVAEDFQVAADEVDDKIWKFRELLSQSLK